MTVFNGFLIIPPHGSHDFYPTVGEKLDPVGVEFLPYLKIMCNDGLYIRRLGTEMINPVIKLKPFFPDLIA